MITRELVSHRILDYLNGKINLPSLVKWSEDALVELTESGQDMPNEESLLHVLGYIGAGDNESFPLTWEVLSDLLASLGVKSLKVEIA
jgi:hypothetical protein